MRGFVESGKATGLVTSDVFGRFWHCRSLSDAGPLQGLKFLIGGGGFRGGFGSKYSNGQAEFRDTRNCKMVALLTFSSPKTRFHMTTFGNVDISQSRITWGGVQRKLARDRDSRGIWLLYKTKSSGVCFD